MAETLARAAQVVNDFLYAQGTAAFACASSILYGSLTYEPSTFGCHHSLRIVNLPWSLSLKSDLASKIDLNGAISCELPPNGFSDLSCCISFTAEFPRRAFFYWDAPSSLDVILEQDCLEEMAAADSLLPGGPVADQGALRSFSFQVRMDDGSTMNLQMRWYPEGSPLCSQEVGGCSLYLIAVDPTNKCSYQSLIFELQVGRLRRILCHDFSESPQWGVADFGDLREAMTGSTSQRVRLSTSVLEAPAQCFIRSVPAIRDNSNSTTSQVVWGLGNWLHKVQLGPAVYASPQFELLACRGIRLLIGLGVCAKDDLVGPLVGIKRNCSNVATLPLAVFMGAPPGTSLRFKLRAGTSCSTFFHKFSFTCGFAGTRDLLRRASDAVGSNNELHVHLEILGTIPVGDEIKPEVLPAI